MLSVLPKRKKVNRDSMHLHVEFMDDVAYYHDEDGPG
jgi:hypothetical protein